MLQLNPPIPVRTPLGDGWAHIVIDYSPEFNTVWVVALHDAGTIKHFDANDLRVDGNPTFGIPRPKRPKSDPRTWTDE